MIIRTKKAPPPLIPALFTLCALIACVPAAGAESFTAGNYIRSVIAASPEMSSAEESFKRAENAYRAALLDAALPSFSLSFGETFYDEQDTRLRVDKEDVSSRLSASWRLYDSSNSPLRRIKTASLDYEAAKLTLLIARKNEALKALGRFYALYSAQKRIDIARVDLESREKQYADTNEQYRSGTRSKIDVTQSEGDKLQSELEVAQAEVAEIKALMAFNELLDESPETAQEVAVSTQVPDIKVPLPAEDVDRALRDNFSLRRQRLLLEKARLTHRKDVMGEYPRLSVDASWSKTSLGVLGTPGGGDPSYSLGASLSFPFGFFGAQNYLGLKSAGSVLKSAELSLADSERSLKTEVLVKQKDIELQVRIRKLRDFQVAAQKAAAGNYRYEYSQGGATSLQVDNAQTKLLSASNGQITAINALDVALAEYRALLGEKIWE